MATPETQDPSAQSPESQSTIETSVGGATFRPDQFDAHSLAGAFLARGAIKISGHAELSPNDPEPKLQALPQQAEQQSPTPESSPQQLAA